MGWMLYGRLKTHDFEARDRQQMSLLRNVARCDGARASAVGCQILNILCECPRLDISLSL